MEVLKQPQYTPMAVEEQVMIIYALVNGYLDNVELDKVGNFEKEFLKFMRSSYVEICKGIAEKNVLDNETEAALKKAIKEFKDTFVTVTKSQADAG
jgi:F-type H+-transporting ATPase subunit alpha